MTTTTASAHQPRTRWPGLDSLRGLAVATVVAYHLGFLPGGFLGVDVFFVLSGYLVTALALREVDRTGSLGIRAFWMRRVRRLAPALAVLVPVVLVAAHLAGWDRTAYDALAWDATATLTWWANWRQAFGEVGGYWSTTPSLFRHAWSLAIEEQFYLLWPLVLAVLLVVARRLRWAAATTVAAAATTVAAASATWGIVLAHRLEVADLSRVYVGTGTRIAGPLIGCALAAVLHGRTLPERGRGLVAIRAAGAVALAGLAALMATVDVADPSLYRTGLLPAASILAAVALLAARTLRSTDPVTTWLGHRSYAIYLWSWPIQVLAEHRWLDISRWSIAAIVVPATIALAEVSWHLIEYPAQRRTSWATRPLPRRSISTGMAAVATIAVVLIAATAVAPPVHERVSSAAAAEAALAPPPTTAPPTSITEPDEPVAQVELGPEAVMIVGDSIAFTAGLYAPGPDDLPEGIASIDSRAIIGCGVLSGSGHEYRDGNGQWVAPAGGACTDVDPAIETGLSGSPDVLLLMPGAWEWGEVRTPTGEVIPAQSDEIKTSLIERIHDIADRAAATGARTVLIPWACPGPDTGPERSGHHVEWVGEVLTEAAADHPAVALADLPEGVCVDDDPAGEATPAKNRAMGDEVHIADLDGGRWAWHTWLGPSITSTRPTTPVEG